MSVSCEKLWKLLIDKDMTRTGLRISDGVNVCGAADRFRGLACVVECGENAINAVQKYFMSMIMPRHHVSRSCTLHS